MAIPQTRYVDITSGVAAGAAVRQRELIGRVFTTNPLLPTGSFSEFESAAAVSAVFGSTSEEYKRSAAYFGWVSKKITSPQKISFARWADEDTAPQIFGAVKTQSVSAWQAITAGSFTLTLGATTNTMSSLDFSGAASLAAVAGIIQTAIRTKTGTMWTAATVTWNATRGSFDFVGGDVGEAVISVTAGVSNDVASPLGWLTGATLSDGADAQTVTDVLDQSAEASSNFGSFLFMPDLTTDEATEAAVWSDVQNVRYQFCHRCTAANYSALNTALIGYGGVSLTLSVTANEYPDQVPMTILAATDYTKRDAVQDYMYQFFPLTPSVTNSTDADLYDAARVNYYGRTQSAGQNIDFYQRGVLMGGATDPVDMNVFANEQWLKDAAAAAVLGLLLALSKVSANKQGRSQLLAILQGVVDQALFNGTISVGKTLNTNQKLYIGQQTGDDNAWYQVQNIGYWLNCVLQSYVTVDGRTEWKAVYTLIYSKDDVIRKVDGSHQLI